MNPNQNIKSQYKKYKLRRVSFLNKVARLHNVSKSHVCNVIAGRKNNPGILKTVKSLISQN